MNIYNVGAVLSVILSFIGILSKLKPILDSVNRIVDTVENNSLTIKEIREELNANNEKTESVLESVKLCNDATLDILRQHIIEMTDGIFNRGFILTEEVYCLRKLSRDYTALGGNSTVDVRVKKAFEMVEKKGEFIPEIRF